MGSPASVPSAILLICSFPPPFSVGGDVRPALGVPAARTAGVLGALGRRKPPRPCSLIGVRWAAGVDLGSLSAVVVVLVVVFIASS